MSKTKILFAISALIFATLACNALLPSAEPTLPAEEPNLPASEADVPRVPLEQALTEHAAGAAIFVDVRGPADYETSHIPGAINIPLSEFENNIANVDLDKDAWIITYCT